VATPVGFSVHLALWLEMPVSIANVRVPVGGVAPTPLVSVTVAVQIVEPPAGTVFGLQLTVVVVECATEGR
jgi:hypothetical protein